MERHHLRLLQDVDCDVLEGEVGCLVKLPVVGCQCLPCSQAPELTGACCRPQQHLFIVLASPCLLQRFHECRCHRVPHQTRLAFLRRSPGYARSDLPQPCHGCPTRCRQPHPDLALSQPCQVVINRGGLALPRLPLSLRMQSPYSPSRGVGPHPSCGTGLHIFSRPLCTATSSSELCPFGSKLL